ncbi:MAG: small subunit ribosomal protein, partial [Solirubrobacteraceae bacterium]|nr:small subunit ribosomal protein [Solirubrobacteraceae bacterium]
QLALLPTRERMAALADLTKLRANLGGVKNMTRPPNAMVVIDLKVEEIAVREAQRLRIPIIGLVDTNCDPDGIEYVIPGNDDAIRSCALIINSIGDVVGEGSAVFRAQEEQARKEAEEQQRLAAEERARRDAEEKEAREAAEREAAAAAKATAEAAAPPAEEAAAAAPPAAPRPARAKPTPAPRKEAAAPLPPQAPAASAAQEPAAAAAPEPPSPAAEPPAASTVAEPEATKTQARGGGDRQAAEAEVAEAVQAAGRPQPDPQVRQGANTDVAPAQRDNVKGTSPDPAPPAEDPTPDPASPPAEPAAMPAAATETETTTEDVK